MSIPQRLMVLLAAVPCLAALLALAAPVVAGQNNPHRFKPGDVISADLFNELFSRLNEVTEGFSSPTDLLGAWNITHVRTLSGGASPYVRHPSDLFSTLTDTVVFSDNGNGTYSYATQSFAFHAWTVAQPQTGGYYLLHNRLIAEGTYGSVTRLSQNKFVWDLSPGYVFIVFERQLVPPPNPSDLAANLSNLSVTLSWLDNSADEASFRILRRDGLQGAYTEVGIALADATTYTDTVPGFGTYWYRIVATNTAGDSLGSNVARIYVVQ